MDRAAEVACCAIANREPNPAHGSKIVLADLESRILVMELLITAGHENKPPRFP
jgi:hypothetical protein